MFRRRKHSRGFYESSPVPPRFEQSAGTLCFPGRSGRCRSPRRKIPWLLYTTSTASASDTQQMIHLSRGSTFGLNGNNLRSCSGNSGNEMTTSAWQMANRQEGTCLTTRPRECHGLAMSCVLGHGTGLPRIHFHADEGLTPSEFSHYACSPMQASATPSPRTKSWTGRELAAIQIQRIVRGWRARVWAAKEVYYHAWRALTLIQVPCID